MRYGFAIDTEPSHHEEDDSQASLDGHNRQHESHQTKGTITSKYHTKKRCRKLCNTIISTSKSMEKIEHKKKGIGTCLDGQAKKKRRRKKEPAIRNRQAQRPFCLAPELVCIYSGMVYVLVEAGHAQIQCF